MSKEYHQKRILLGKIGLRLNLVLTDGGKFEMLVVNIASDKLKKKERHLTFHFLDKVFHISKNKHSKSDPDPKIAFHRSFENENYMVSGWMILSNKVATEVSFDDFQKEYKCPQEHISFRFWVAPSESMINPNEKFQSLLYAPEEGHQHREWKVFYEDLFEVDGQSIGIEVLNSCCPAYFRPKINLKRRSFDGIAQELGFIGDEGILEIKSMVPQSLWDDGE